MVDGVFRIPLSGKHSAPRRGPAEGTPDPPGLSDFLAGPENGLAAVAVHALLDEPITPYNPLVLYGASGTGKTHLARGVFQEWKRRRLPAPAISTTAADFARAYADAIESQSIGEFRARHRAAGLLVVEDLAEIASKEAAQQELLHTLDAVLEQGGKILITLSAAPNQVPSLLPGLVGRLSAGLTVPIVPPAAPTRLAVLEELAARRGVRLLPEAARLLAEGFAATVPQLAGALVQLDAALVREDASIDAARVLAFLGERAASSSPSLRGIAALTARYFALKVAELKSPSRQRAVVMARSVAMYLARQLTGKSLKQIGDYFGGRDHTTVLHGCRKLQKLVENDPGTQKVILHLRGRLGVT
ncbi:MAG: DnaA/Hda family protein [Pirellulales bacterium]